MAILMDLYAWREKEAQTKDRPRRRILPDEILVEVARRAPRDVEGLQKIRGLDPRDLRRHSAALLASVQRGRGIAEEDLPILHKRRRLEPQEEAALELSTAALRALCRAQRIAPPLVARGDDVENLVRAHSAGSLVEAEHSLLRGWRGEMFGTKVVGFLDGKFQLGFDQETGYPSLRPCL